ncbi:hypothetical protein [Halorubrum sp. HHNYT27]|uniref:hypothetical protein n=1 Tax=Halorubrum sp. HHNYT27 TaxID=3402275 RepID=UPI003EBFD57C
MSHSAFHAVVASFFLYLGVGNGAAGALVSLLLSGLVGILLVAAGVVTARITEQRT